MDRIILNAEENQDLLVWSRSTSLEHRYVVRAKAILFLSDGQTYDQVSQNAGIGKTAIAKWKRRYLASGIDGLRDAARPGKPRQYDEFLRKRIVQKACEKPSGGYTSWSQRRIAKEVGVCQATVSKVLKEEKLRPHKVDYWCGHSTDPDFEKKMLAVVGLYMNPPENALVLCVDEKTQIQALDRTQPELPLRVGNPRRLTATYTRHGTVSLIASLAVHTGELIGQSIPRNTAENFLHFLKRLDRIYTRKHLHIIVDNLAVHKQHDVREWLSHKRKITIHYTPTYSSWLNQIEIWFNIFSKDVLKGGVWKSRNQLVHQIMDYIKTYNNSRAKPFVWTYNAKNIGSPFK